VKEELKSRVVTFRLSEREYTSIMAACDLDRCSISSVARRTALAWAESLTAQPQVDTRLDEINDRLDILSKLLEKKPKE
jgi:hypothetical protein